MLFLLCAVCLIARSLFMYFEGNVIAPRKASPPVKTAIRRVAARYWMEICPHIYMCDGAPAMVPRRRQFEVTEANFVLYKHGDEAMSFLRVESEEEETSCLLKFPLNRVLYRILKGISSPMALHCSSRTIVRRLK